MINVNSNPISKMEKSGIVRSTQNGIGITKKYQGKIRSLESTPEEKLFTKFSVHSDETEAILRRVYRKNKLFAIEYISIYEFMNGSSPRDIIESMIYLSYLRNGEPRSEMTPEHFIPIHGEFIEGIVPFALRAIIYVWRPNCEPCETVKSDLESMAESGSLDKVMRLSVFGPNNAVTLEKELDVVGAPTILFLSQGAVDSRLVSAPPRNAIRKEVSIIKNG